MSVTKYLGTEITHSVGDHAAAFIDDENGRRRCFLGGLSEVKKYLRERSYGQHAGPRQSTWEIVLRGGCCSMYGTHAAALRDFAYYVQQGCHEKVTLVRIEYCRHAGCDGHGEIPSRRGNYTTRRPCPQHEERVEVVEEVWCSSNG